MTPCWLHTIGKQMPYADDEDISAKLPWGVVNDSEQINMHKAFYCKKWR